MIKRLQEVLLHAEALNSWLTPTELAKLLNSTRPKVVEALRQIAKLTGYKLSKREHLGDFQYQLQRRKR